MWLTNFFVNLPSRRGIRSIFRRKAGLMMRIRRDARRMIRSSRKLDGLERKEEYLFEQGDVTELKKQIKGTKKDMIRLFNRALDIIWQVNRIRLIDIDWLNKDIKRLPRDGSAQKLERELASLGSHFNGGIAMLKRLQGGEDPVVVHRTGSDIGALEQELLSGGRLGRRHSRQIKGLERQLGKELEPTTVDSLSRAFETEQVDLDRILTEACIGVYRIIQEIDAITKRVGKYQLSETGKELNQTFDKLKKDAFESIEIYHDQLLRLYNLTQR